MITHDIRVRASRVIEFNVGILQHSHTNFFLNFTRTNGMLVLLVTLLNNEAHDWVSIKCHVSCPNNKISDDKPFPIHLLEPVIV
jgi:hypothetical protein